MSNDGIGFVVGTLAIQYFCHQSIKRVRFKADHKNKDIMYIGKNGVANYPLAAGEDTGWVEADLLSEFCYRYGSKNGRLHFWYQF